VPHDVIVGEILEALAASPHIAGAAEAATGQEQAP
jgi:hypothetical protein